MKKQLSAFFAIAGIASIVCAESTLTISPDGVTLDGATLAGGKLTAETQVDFLNANGGTLDLNGHNLTFSSAYASRFSVAAQTVVTNSSETLAISAFRLTSVSSQFSSEFQSMRFGGNLKLVVAGRASSNAGFQTAVNSHTGGTELDGYFNVNETTTPLYNANQHPRFNTDSAFGTGPLTLKNGAAISYTGSSNCTFPWEYISVEGGTNQFRCPNATASFLNPLKVASSSTLMWCSERQGNLGQIWPGDMSEVYGTLLVEGRAGTFLAVSNDIPGTVALGPSAGAQLQYRGTDATFEVGALETRDLTAYSANAFLQNTAGLKTLKVGAANKDTVFYGNIACTGSKGSKDWKLEKTGTGTLTLAGTNTYLSSTILSGGALKLAGVGTLGAPDSTADVQFTGGTLEYGDGAAADYSGRIKSSTAPISIDTGTNSIVFATALAASNEGGLVKKGDGVLVLEAKPNHSGRTIVSNGTLRIAGAYEYSSVDGISPDIRNSFEVSEGANLEVTFRSRGSVHAGEAGLLTGLPNGTTVNFENADYRGMPRFGNVTTFSGTVNFVNSLDNSGDLGAGGLVTNEISSVGSANIDWGVTGEPAAEHTRIFNIAGGNGMTVNLGALRQTSPNAMIHCRHRCEINIGSLGTNSVINGQFEVQDSSLLTLNSVGGRLTLGENFAVLAAGATDYTRTPILNVSAGEIVNNADLSSFSVNLSNGVTIGGNGTWPAGMTMPGSYSIAASTSQTTCLNGVSVDFTDGASLDLDLGDFDGSDKNAAPELLSAASINGKPDASLIAAINEGSEGGEWAFAVRRGAGQTLVLRWRAKTGFVVRFR